MRQAGGRVLLRRWLSRRTLGQPTAHTHPGLLKEGESEQSWIVHFRVLHGPRSGAAPTMHSLAACAGAVESGSVVDRVGVACSVTALPHLMHLLEICSYPRASLVSGARVPVLSESKLW